MKKYWCTVIFLFLFPHNVLLAQTGELSYWHGVERSVRYLPEGKDFVITNGKRKFTRALYGTNTAFRVETGDLPEFALYLPGMGGNIKFGLIGNDSSKWLTTAAKIKARYRPGSMMYEIEDPLLSKGKLFITILAMADAEGAIIKVWCENVASPVQLMWVYGGVTGKKFSRDGDMGPDPESVFYLKTEYCKGDEYTLNANSFLLDYSKGRSPSIAGIFPLTSKVKIVNALHQSSPEILLNSVADSLPAVAGVINLLNRQENYFSFQKQDSTKEINKDQAVVFAAAEKSREQIAERIKVITPDPYINTIGGAISIAADAIWESPSFMHGAVGWRMRLNGWRGAYAADVLGWHDRARQHFRSYALSQITSPDSGKVVADTALHLARQLEKLGTSVFSSGYISRNPGGDIRPHHYDMNLVFIDELLWHFNWTGDTVFVKEMWPLLKRHLAWEKRNFDPDDDGLYDAYAAIWASDALQYSGGAVTHSSAYNYRANKMAAQLAGLVGEDPSTYKKEADKILSAVNKILWLKDKGVYAEYKDALGEKALHEDPALWTIYHSIDSEVPDAFKAWQSLDHITHHIPHIPIRAKGLEDGYYTISTSNWMPYTWSLNNVALAELMHTSLAYWQGGQNEEAFRLWKSSLLESMYLGGSPGNFQQISTYDAIRGEAYRDFADPVGMTARSLIQGLFGILPDALNNKLTIHPGFPASWKNASIETPDIKFDFKRNARTDTYKIVPSFNKKLRLTLAVIANGSGVESIIINGKKAQVKFSDNAVGKPMLMIDAGFAENYSIAIKWKGILSGNIKTMTYLCNSSLITSSENLSVESVYDPQQAFKEYQLKNKKLTAITGRDTGYKRVFIKVKEGDVTYWKPLSLVIKNNIEIIAGNKMAKNELKFTMVNNADSAITGRVLWNGDLFKNVSLAPHSISNYILSTHGIIPGTNIISFIRNDEILLATKNIITWNVSDKINRPSEQVSLEKYFNDKVSNIFRNQYLSPRPAVPTLQLPTQGIGDWTHPLLTADIDDRGFRKMAVNNIIIIPQGITFKTPSDTLLSNIIFTSQWDNYPSSVTIPLSGSASHIYLLMAGSTNPMQSQMVNGTITITYTDGSSDSLLLKNPENWWPIEQDYFDDGFAFKTNGAKPVRIHLKTGKIVSDLDNSIESYNGKMIEGGAATVLDLPLQKSKIIQSLTLQSIANDVIIGLMGVTLVR